MWLRLLFAFGVGVTIPVASYLARSGTIGAWGAAVLLLGIAGVVTARWLASRAGDPTPAVAVALLAGFPVGGYLAARVWLAQYGLTNEWGVSLFVMMIEAAVLAAISLAIYAIAGGAFGIRAGAHRKGAV